jgi:hypothetical protein
VKLGHLRFIFKGQLSILLRLLEFVRNRELLKLSNKAIAENPHAQLGALLISCAPLASRASVAHLRCALRDLTWVTLSQYRYRYQELRSRTGRSRQKLHKFEKDPKEQSCVGATPRT